VPWNTAVTAEPMLEKVQLTPLPATKPSPAGSESVTVVAPGVAPRPTLATTIWYWPSCPTAKSARWRLSIVIAASPDTATGSASASLAALRSFAVETLTRLVTDGMAAASTATVSANPAESAAAMVPAKVAVTIGPLAAKVQPAPGAGREGQAGRQGVDHRGHGRGRSAPQVLDGDGVDAVLAGGEGRAVAQVHGQVRAR